MTIPKPSAIQGQRPNIIIVDELHHANGNVELVLQSEPFFKHSDPVVPKPRPRAERSTPVRNPAFREHDGLKALQRKLHTQSK